jgi:hypothetical protein
VIQRTLAVIAVLAFALATGPAVSGRPATSKAKQKHGHNHTAKKKHKRRHASAQPAPKPESTPEPPRPATFDGSCDFSGTVTLTPGMTNTPQPVTQHALAPGTCTGTFSDTKGRTSSLDKAPVTYAAESAGDQVSCLDGTATGTGTLSFPGGALAFAFSETRLVATPLLRLTGTAGGGMDGFATPSQRQDTVASVQACNGSGLEAFAIDAHFQTTSPISG